MKTFNNNNNTYKIHILTHKLGSKSIEKVNGISHKIDLSNWKVVLNPFERKIIIYEKETIKYEKEYKKFITEYRIAGNNTTSSINHNIAETEMYKKIATDLRKEVIYRAYKQLMNNINYNPNIVPKKYLGHREKRDSGYTSEVNSNDN